MVRVSVKVRVMLLLLLLLGIIGERVKVNIGVSDR
jgi:hypothetical protein